MKKFNYRFSGLQGVRSIELDNLRMDLFSAQKLLDEAQQELRRLQAELESSYDEIARLRGAQRSQVLMQSMEGYGAQLRFRLQEQAGKILRRQHELEQARHRVSEKHRETKVLEKHREKQFELHLKDMERDMQRELDENTGSLGQN